MDKQKNKDNLKAIVSLAYKTTQRYLDIIHDMQNDEKYKNTEGIKLLDSSTSNIVDLFRLSILYSCGKTYTVDFGSKEELQPVIEHVAEGLKPYICQLSTIDNNDNIYLFTQSCIVHIKECKERTEVRYD